MLSVTRCSSEMASSYFTKDDYYLKDVGHWSGKLAESMGITGVIKKEDFIALVNGTSPDGKFKIISGGKANKHTAGVDLTFSAPKSVSIMGLVMDDKRIIDAHDKAVQTTLNYVEENNTRVRIKKDGKVLSEHTGNMLVGSFQHVASRELDPQLHTHCLVLNMTQKSNGDMRAMDYMEIFDKKMFLGQMYRNELAMNLKEMGYEIQADQKGLFEIKGVPSELIKEFSRRSEQITERTTELQQKFPNVAKAKLRAMAAVETRKRKDEPTMEALKTEWDSLIKELGISKEKVMGDLEKTALVNKASMLFDDKTNITDRVKQAVDILIQYEAVINKDDILRVAGKLSVGEYRFNELVDTLEKSDTIKLGNNKHTTKETVDMERNIVNAVKDGQGKLDSIMDKETINQGIVRYELEHGFNLTKGQKEAVGHILGSSDRVIAIQGDAGTGKTTMLDVVRTLLENEPIGVVGLSFTGKAASEIEEASGIKAQTISSMLHSKDDLHGKLVVVDEASMVSIKASGALLEKCNQHTRLVLIGDTKQLQSIEQGKIFSSLQEKKVINTVRMSEVQRQSDLEYKSVVDDLNAKKVAKALGKLDKQCAKLSVN